MSDMIFLIQFLNFQHKKCITKEEFSFLENEEHCGVDDHNISKFIILHSKTKFLSLVQWFQLRNCFCVKVDFSLRMCSKVFIFFYFKNRGSWCSDDHCDISRAHKFSAKKIDRKNWDNIWDRSLHGPRRPGPVPGKWGGIFQMGRAGPAHDRCFFERAGPAKREMSFSTAGPG